MRGLALLKKASLVGAFFVSAIGSALAAADCAPAGPTQVVRVARVVDGDTLKLVDGRSVRLIGLNAPERARGGRPAEPLAEAAWQRLQALVEQAGERVSLWPGRQARDHYGRILAHAYVAGRNLEAQLLREGLGYLVALSPNVALAGCQAAAEREAREARLGLWARDPVRPVSALRRGGFALLRGEVLRVERNGGGSWIEMGELVLQVPRRHQAAFSDLPALAGRELLVRGWVIDRSRRGGLRPGQARWLLQLSDPHMLEVLR